MAPEDNVTHLSGMILSGLVCFPMALRAAINLRVFDIIADAGETAQLSPSEMVAEMPTTNKHAATALERILKILVANDMLTMSKSPRGDKSQWVYGLNRQSLCFVEGDDGVSIAPLLHLCTDKATIDSFYYLEDTVLQGGCTPFYKANGKQVFEFIAMDPNYDLFFHKAMSSCATTVLNEVLKVYKGFNQVKELVDIGGGDGTSLSLIVSKFPHIRGVNFDLPNVISHAQQFPGVEHVAGNMFESVPNTEAIFMKDVLHNWNDDRCIALLKNCCTALPNGGVVIIAEFVVPSILGTDDAFRYTLSLDLLMAIFCSGGKKRTVAEFDNLSKAAGFDEMRVFPIKHGLHVIEFHKIL